VTLNHPIFTRWPAQSRLGWVRNLIGFYEAREIVGFDRFLHVQAWLDRGLAHPAVQRGLEVTAA
jgi:GST-like protein